ncbi:MAG: FeS-binding protein [Desulfatibacillaceae bacterium]
MFDSTEQKVLRWVYVAVMVAMGITGMAQLPIMKRYYISDIPGLGWLADFYATHALHYMGAALLLTLLAYQAVVYLARGRRTHRLTVSGWFRFALVAGLVATGAFRVAKNLPDVTFSPGFTFAIDLTHLGLFMVFMFSALGFAIAKKRWLVPREEYATAGARTH